MVLTYVFLVSNNVAYFFLCFLYIKSSFERSLFKSFVPLLPFWGEELFVFLLYLLSYCCCSVAMSCPTLCDLMDCSTPGSAVLHYLLEFAQIPIHWVSDAVWPSRPLCPLLLLLSLFPSIRVFSSESVLHIRWPEYWSFSFSISPSNDYSEFYILSHWLVWSPCCPRDSQSSPAAQFKNINFFWHSVFFMGQLSHS